MSDLQTRIRLRASYLEVTRLLQDMACDAKRLDMSDFEAVRPLLLSLCHQAEELPEVAAHLANSEGAELLRWYAMQWPKRDTDHDDTPSQARLAEEIARLGAHVMKSMQLNLNWYACNLMGIHSIFDTFLINRIVDNEIGLYTYDLSTSDYYESESSPEQTRGVLLSRVVGDLAESGQQSLLAKLLEQLHQALELEPEILPQKSRVLLLIACFNQAIELADSNLISNLAKLLVAPSSDDLKSIIGNDTDRFYRAMINAAQSGLRLQVEPMIRNAIDSGAVVNGYKSFIVDLEHHTGIEAEEVTIKFARCMDEDDFCRTEHLEALMAYYAVTDKPVVADQIEYLAKDALSFVSLIKNDYGSFYDSEKYSLNMKNVKALMCEYLGQHAGQVKVMAAIPELSGIVKTLPYWHDHNFAADLGL